MDLFGQMQANNRQINRLLNLVDNLQYENRKLSRRMDEINREPQPSSRRTSEIYRRTRGPTGASEPRETRTPTYRPTGETGTNQRSLASEYTNRTPEEDVVFYFYLPRRDETPEGLSQETITQATTRSLFNEIENPNNLSCPISLEMFQPEQSVIMINQCRHIFNEDHLSRWFETKSTCPMCRCNIQVTETPTLNRFANMATQMLSNVITTGVNDILNDLRI